MSRERLIWALRKILIVALLCSAGYLVSRTGYFQPVGQASSVPSGGGSGGVSSGETYVHIWPRAMMVCRNGGDGTAAAYDGDSLSAALRQFAAFLGETLGTAEAEWEISEETFRRGLSNGCLFLELGGSYPLDVLSLWLGAGGGEEGRSADVLYVSAPEGTVELSYRDAGHFYRCATAAQAETLAGRMADFQASPAILAFQDARYSGLDPYTVILRALPEKYALRAYAGETYIPPDQLMTAVGMNSFVASSYQDADGSLVYTEDERTLRLGPDGTVSYRRTDNALASSLLSLTEAVNEAGRLVERITGQIASDGQMALSGVERGESDSAYTVYFDYSVSGIPVRLPEGRAAIVIFQHGTVVRASIRLRGYTVTEEAELLMSMSRAAVIAAAQDGVAPSLVYLDTGDRANCVWIME